MSNDIDKMDFKQLRNEVQLLRDELAIFKRKYEDIIYNLDDDNFSSQFLKEKDGMKTKIEVNAEGIKTKVSNTEFESAKTILANEITSKVNTLNNNLSTQITQTEAEIKATVSATYDDLTADISSVSAQADKISTRVGKVENGEFGNFTLFEQTADGFELTGDVTINGDNIVSGTITGASLQNSNKTTKLELGHYTGSTVGDLNLIRFNSGGSETNIFSVIDNFQSIYLNAMGKAFLQSSGTTTYPKGTWNFEGCDVIGIGGTTTAVFA